MAGRYIEAMPVVKVHKKISSLPLGGRIFALTRTVSNITSSFSSSMLRDRLHLESKYVSDILTSGNSDKKVFASSQLSN